MLHVHLDVGQLDDLMGIVGARFGQPGLPTATRWGLDRDDFGGCPGLAPGVPLGVLEVCGFTQGGSAEGGRLAWPEFRCARASRAAIRASRILIRSSCCRVITSTWMTKSWTTTGVCSHVVGSRGNPSGSGREATTGEPLATCDRVPVGRECRPDNSESGKLPAETG
jgi:hypothetical protein